MSRGWTWLDETDITEEEMEKREPQLNALAAAWSRMHDTQEQRCFRRQAAMEDPGEYDGPDFEEGEEEEQASYDLHGRMQAAAEQAQLAMIESELERLGARMMRAYEHWNEDEAYMQYMECDRFGDACY